MKEYIKPELNLCYGEGPFMLTTSGDANNSPWNNSWDGVLEGGN